MTNPYEIAEKQAIEDAYYKAIEGLYRVLNQALVDKTHAQTAGERFSKGLTFAREARDIALAKISPED